FGAIPLSPDCFSRIHPADLPVGGADHQHHGIWLHQPILQPARVRYTKDLRAVFSARDVRITGLELHVKTAAGRLASVVLELDFPVDSEIAVGVCPENLVRTRRSGHHFTAKA